MRPANPAIHSSAIQALAGLGSWACDPATGWMNLSPEAARILGSNPDQAISREHMHASIHLADRPRVEFSWQEAMSGKALDLEYRLVVGNGEPLWVWERASFEFDGQGRPVSAIGFLQDVTQRRQCQEEMRYQANYDALTSLPNRNLLMEHLAMAIPIARRKGHRLAVLFVDLDRFKQVNDALGHDMGDELLRQVAQRMKDCLRESDIVARQGGDEFIVVLHDIVDDSDAGLVALKLVEQLTQSFDLGGADAHIGASIGLTIFPEDGSDADTLFRNADMAMYQAKATGRETLCFFETGMRMNAVQRYTFEGELRRALAQNEFVLHYQPIYGMSSQEPYSVEALIRWQHPELGLVGPDRFIPEAEENGLIRDIGRWVVETACRQLAEWQALGLDTRVSVNVSSRQIPEGLTLDWLRETLTVTEIDPTRLTFEITEGVMIRDTPATHRWMRQVAELGIQLSLDDFGTGYASLGFLRQFRMQQVKIDKSFVMAMGEDPLQHALVKSIIDIGRNMGLMVTAEGIEDAHTLATLMELGCNFAQGFHLSRPLPPEKVTALLAESITPASVAKCTARLFQPGIEPHFQETP